MKSFSALTFLQLTFISIHTVGAYCYTLLRGRNENGVNVDSNKNPCYKWNHL
jgi:hypothetical protein